MRLQDGVLIILMFKYKVPSGLFRYSAALEGEVSKK